MNRKNISKPNSRIDAFNVLPNICNPFECLDNLNIRNTRTKRITRSIAKDIAWFVDLSWNSSIQFRFVWSLSLFLRFILLSREVHVGRWQMIAMEIFAIDFYRVFLGIEFEIWYCINENLFNNLKSNLCFVLLFFFLQWNLFVPIKNKSLTCGLTGALGRFSVSSSSATTVANVMK